MLKKSPVSVLTVREFAAFLKSTQVPFTALRPEGNSQGSNSAGVGVLVPLTLIPG